MTPEVYRKIRDTLTDDAHKLLVDILWFTGERIGAVVQLRIDDVYRNASRREPREVIIFRGSTRKDGSTREVPIHPDLALRLQAYTPPGDGWLFPGTEGHYARRSADAILRRSLVKLGLADAGYSLHSFRRGFITRLHGRGVAIKVIQGLTGHKSLTVLSRYVEVTDEMKKTAIGLL